MKTPTILIVDDEPDNFDVIETFLSHEDYELHYAASGQDALTLLETFEPDLILLDVMMPELDGIEVCQDLKAVERWQKVPVIMVTALTAKQDLARCLAAGADDFISKPINRLELSARVRSMLRIREQYQQLDTFNACLEATVHARTKQLHTMVFQDALTKLPSRTFLLQQAMRYWESSDAPCAMLCLDCDHFQFVNGSFGHGVGNQLLMAIAGRLQQHCQESDILARLGEDAFCFFLPQIQSTEQLEPFLQQIQQSFEQSFMVANCEIFVTSCLGIALRQSGTQTAEELLQDADTALYQAKARGQNNVQLFDPQMHTAILERLTLENSLQRALEQQEFVPYYQPIVNLQANKLVGFEALVRWQHPEQGLIAPGRFIPSMETTGLIVPVGLLIFRLACQQLHHWHQQGWVDLTMSINLSVRQFACTTLLEDIDRVLAETGVNPACLKLEITESVILDSAEIAIALTKQLRSRQIQISIDDFGTGYSSLGYLDQFPADNLKIDRSFIQQFQSAETQYPVVNTIITLAQQLNLAVIAEGIETPAQQDWLRQLGCDQGQGYLFAKPLPSEAIEQQFLSTPGS